MKRETKSVRIKDLLSMHGSINLNPPYQRSAGIWNNRRKQNLVHSILTNYDIPKIYVRTTGIGLWEMVDGKQRYQALHEFAQGYYHADNQIEEIAGLNYGSLPPEWQDKFDDALLDVCYLDCTESEARILFRKHGEQVHLNGQEKRNALEGYVREVVAKLATHPFWELCFFGNKRMAWQQTAANLLFLFYRGELVSVKHERLDAFYGTENKERVDKAAGRLTDVMAFMRRAFSDHGRCHSLSKANVIALAWFYDTELRGKITSEEFYLECLDFFGELKNNKDSEFAKSWKIAVLGSGTQAAFKDQTKLLREVFSAYLAD